MRILKFFFNHVAIIIIIACIVTRLSFCNGLEEINEDVNASYISKKLTGAKRSLHMLSDMMVSVTPSSKRSPKKKFELALVGLGRTGSTSFHSALKTLGYTPIHDDEYLELPDLFDEMMREVKSLDEITAEMASRGFDSAFLMTHDFVKWAATKLDVKVILTVRDKSKWAKSWLTVAPAATLLEQRPFKWFEPIRQVQAINREIMINVPTNGKPDLYMDIPTLEAGYEAWVDFVIQTVPQDKLLIFDVKEGWGPLCNFLEKPVPESIPFPHINDRVVVDATVKMMVLMTWIWPLVLIVLPLAMIRFVVTRLFWRKRKEDDSEKKRK